MTSWDQLPRHLSLLSEPVRVRLLALLEADELAVSELVKIVQLPQSTVSRHLKGLRQSGWVRSRSVGSSSMLRATDAPDPAAGAVWSAVREAFAASRQADEDRSRRLAVVASRGGDAQAFFGSRSGEWDSLRRQLFGDRFLAAALAALLPSDAVVADSGCGTGHALEALAPTAVTLFGVDREPAMLARAARRLERWPQVQLRQGPLEALPLRDASVDLALCLLVLHHVSAPHGVLCEAARVLRPGGRLAVVDMVTHRREAYLATLGHEHAGFSEGQVTEAAAAAGLEVDRFAGLGADPDAQGPPLFVAVLRRGSPEG